MPAATGSPAPAPYRDRAVERLDVLVPRFALLARFALAGVLLASGGLKLLDPAGSVRAVRAYRLLPDGAAEVVGYALPAVEVGLGLLLLVGLTTRSAAVGAGLLMLTFSVGIASAWARGLSIDCGCFGGGGDVVPGTASYGLPLLRDAALVLAAALLAWRPLTSFSVDGRHALEDRPHPAAPMTVEEA